MTKSSVIGKPVRIGGDIVGIAPVSRIGKEPSVWPWILTAVALLGILFACVEAFAQASSQPVAVTDWKAQLLELAGVALMAGLTWLVGSAKAYFTAHAKSQLAVYGANVFSRLSDAALTSVQAVEQIAKRDIQSDPAHLKSDAMAYLKTLIGPVGLAELAGIVGLDQVAAVLSTHVEAAVLQVNQAAPAAAK